MKGSINAFNFADTVEEAFLSCSDEFIIKKLPVADGGDYTGEVLRRHLGAATISVEVHDPFGKTIQAEYAVSGNVAIIEMANASGMKLVDSKQLDPLKASSFGTGQIIANAIKNGCTEVFLAIGGSATVDGGMGMMEALGFGFYDAEQRKLVGNGGNLMRVRTIKKPEKLSAISLKIICDVDNPLLGENGAAGVFGPQKGATPKMVVELEKGLKNWAELLGTLAAKELATIEGIGAAGGLAVPLIAFFNAEIVRGANFVLNMLNFEEYANWADIVITGEGKIDRQTLNNKAPFAVATLAGKYNKPVFAICGIAEDEEFLPFDKIYSFVNKTIEVEYAIKKARQFLYASSVDLAMEIMKQKTK